MGWLENMKDKRAAKAADSEYHHLHSEWAEDVELLKKLIAVFTAASKGEDSAPNVVVQKDGEIALWGATGIFHETGRTPSQYVGGSSGFSIPVVAGIRYRVGAMKGTVIPGEELQMDKDSGNVLLTSARIIFFGGIKTQEWRFDKLLGASTSPDETDFFFNVSNRQKTSGIRFDAPSGREFNRFLALAISAAENGFAPVLKELHGIEERIAKEEPVLEQAPKPA
jgi:hypothetical protein